MDRTQGLQSVEVSLMAKLALAMLFNAVLGWAILCEPATGSAADKIDLIGRTAVISSFEPEWRALRIALQNRKDRILNGIEYATGEIEGKPVLLFLSGMSMVNAAMATQFVFDNFTIDRIVFSGVAGGLNPDLRIGDVVVPDRWNEYLEAVFARDTGTGYLLPRFVEHPHNNNYGMIFPQPVEIARAPEKSEKRSWFDVDPQLLVLVKAAAKGVHLNNCTASDKCLDHQPKIVVGGNGVSGQAFVDNSDFRRYIHRTFNADAVDKESAAIAHVAYANGIPFIAFRSLSDLAGGEVGENGFEAFQELAADNSARLVRAFLRALPPRRN
jgi:adenosylhomocysteine nucleosidase